MKRKVKKGTVVITRYNLSDTFSRAKWRAENLTLAAGCCWCEHHHSAYGAMTEDRDEYHYRCPITGKPMTRKSFSYRPDTHRTTYEISWEADPSPKGAQS